MIRGQWEQLHAVSLETLHQLAASYFIDRESTLQRLHLHPDSHRGHQGKGLRGPGRGRQRHQAEA